MKVGNAYYDNKDVSRSDWVMSLPSAQFLELKAIDTWVKRSGYDDPTYKEILNKLRTPANEL